MLSRLRCKVCRRAQLKKFDGRMYSTAVTIGKAEYIMTNEKACMRGCLHVGGIFNMGPR